MKAHLKKGFRRAGGAALRGLKRLGKPFRPVYTWCYNRCYSIGLYTVKGITAVVSAMEKLFGPPCRFIGSHVCELTNNVLDFMQRVADWTDRSFALVGRAAKKLGHAFWSGFRSGGIIEAFHATRAAWREGRQHNQRAVWLTKMVVLPLIPLVALTAFINVFTGLNFALSVNVEGQTIGYISSEEVYNSADKLMQQRIVYVDGQQPVQIQPTYNLSIVGQDDILTDTELCDNLIVASGAKVSEAAGVFVDGTLLGATKDTQAIKDFLASKLEPYETENPGATVSFTRDVSVQEGLYLTESIVSEEELEAALNGKTQEKQEYVVVSGDTPIAIAAKFGLSVSELNAMNPDKMDNLYVGTVLTVANEQNYLGVQVTKQITYEEDIPYETVKENSSQYTVGTQRVTVKGQNGTANVTANVTYVDGIEVSREIVSSETIKEPVTEKILVGTKPKTSSSSGGSLWGGSSSVVGSGNLYWPVPARTRITCGWYGYAGHRAIDIGAPTGTAIHAADSGTVTYAGWYYNYGYCTIINHGNGMQTLYAHQSAILVSVGQTVSRGQQIGRVGATGKAYGSHLHFEVIVNGVKVNPTYYL